MKWQKDWWMSRAHSPTLTLLHIRHSSFSNASFASPTSQALHLIHLASRPLCTSSKTSNFDCCCLLKFKTRNIRRSQLYIRRRFDRKIWHNCHLIIKKVCNDYVTRIKISYLQGGGRRWLGFPDIWSDQKPWWNWCLTPVVNFGEVRRVQLAKSTLLTSSLMPLGSFEVCSDAKERVGYGKQPHLLNP